jgi:hypothetical protein
VPSVQLRFYDFLEEPAACIFRVEDGGRQIHLKYLYLSTALRGVISQKTLLMLKEMDIKLNGSKTDYPFFMFLFRQDSYFNVLQNSATRKVI